MASTAPREAPQLPRLPKELLGSTVFLLKRLGEAVKQRAIAGYVDAGCSPYHHTVLALLAEGASDTQTAIADALGLDRSQLVGILDELEELGLVERKRDPNDRRRHVVTITPAGKRTLARNWSIINRVDDEFLAPLDRRDREALQSLLLRLAAHHDARFAVKD
jgi:DNA-binding MarR family transcriptional regulator